jgi:hypothetical protein
MWRTTLRSTPDMAEEKIAVGQTPRVRDLALREVMRPIV